MKPENLLISVDGFLKVIDFGCAKSLRDDWSPEIQKIDQQAIS